MKSVKNVLYKLIAEQKIAPKDAMMVFKEIDSNEKYVDDDVAVIGMSGKLPKAKNLDEYWHNLRKGENCISEISDVRKADIERVLTDEQKGNVEYRSAGFLEEIDKFDAAFFRISPKEAKYMEPEQRMFLEAAWEAIEDAGYAGQIYGTNTGVFVGHDHVSGSIYSKYTGGVENSDTLALTGVYPSILPSRIAYYLDLKGPSIVYDTACSSGLVALHQACQALKTKQCDMVITGGISLQLWPVKFNSFKMVETENEKVRAFDKNSSGTVWGEGVCAFMLRPLSKALEDRDNIHAVIKGSAINNDGISSGITAPNAEAQEEVIVNAWKEAKIDVETISYIEAHGTGTVIGDPIEIKALSNAFSRFTAKKQFCGIGSLKPSIGHLVSASGTASLMKVILALKNREIPPTINFMTPNPFINFKESQLYVNDRLRNWENEGYPRRAGISCFGFSGTNCHLVVEEAPESEMQSSIVTEEPRLFVLSAKSANVLKNMLRKYCEYLNGKPEASLANICYTACVGRRHYEYRIALVAKTLAELGEKLKLAGEVINGNNTEKGILYAAHKVVTRHSGEGNGNELTEDDKLRLSRKANEKVKEMLSDGVEEELLLEFISNNYIKGADFDWLEHLCKGKNLRKVSLPVYPFERTRYWCLPDLKRQEASSSSEENGAAEMVHPLLGYCIADNMLSTIYRNHLSPKTHWTLSDHVILRKGTLTGTSYIEMARAACEKYFNSSKIELRDILFLQPFDLDAEELREIQTNIRKENGYAEFVIYGKNGEEWERYAEGKAYAIDGENKQKCNVRDILNRFTEKIDGSDIKEKIKGAEFGPRWRNIEAVYRGKEEILAKIKLPKEFLKDMREYNIHPSLMDNAVNVTIRLNDRDCYLLPFSYGSIKFCGRMPGEFYSYITDIRKSGNDNNLTRMDVRLIDMDGDIFAEISDYGIREVSEKDFDQRRWENFFEAAWVEKSLEHPKTTEEKGSILILKDNGCLGNDVAASLAERGRNVIEVNIGNEFTRTDGSKYVIRVCQEDFTALLADVKNKNVSQIIHLGTLQKEPENEELKNLDEYRERGMLSLFYMVKGLLSIGCNENIEMLLVTGYANEVNRREIRICPHNAAFLGMGKVIPMEYDHLKCRGIDIDDGVDAQTIVNELYGNEKEYSIAYRDGKRYIEEFRRLGADKTKEEPLKIRKNGTYVITGGLGAIGLEICKYLSSGQQVNLCLLNRTQMPDREAWDRILEEGSDIQLCKRLNTIQSIEKTGSVISCYSADISKEDEIQAALGSIRERFGRILGVFHCAGIAGNGFIINKDESTFLRVTDPKMRGTWLLDKLTEVDNPEIFVLFSSAYTLTGGPGQSDYCAANSYLDSYSYYRSRRSGRTVTINWPAWKETGMAAGHGFEKSTGLFKNLTNAKAMTLFDEIVNRRMTRVLVGELDVYGWNRIKNKLQTGFSAELRMYLDKKTKQLGFVKSAESSPKERKVTLLGTADSQPTELQQILGRIWAGILEVDEVDIKESFYNMGGDSILATQMVKEISREYPGTVTISDIFSNPTLEEISNFIKNKLAKKEMDKKTEEDNDRKLKEMLEGLELGLETEENVLDLLNSFKEREE